MKCFNHTSIDAVALCKSCGKSICHDCLEEIENGIACKGTCVQRAIEINEMTDKTIKMMPSTENIMKSTGSFAGPLFFLASGTIFSVVGLKELDFIFYLGVVFLLYGIYNLVVALKRRQENG